MTTKPIHILTHPLGDNYGGIMQAYALQQALIQLGYEPVTLDIPFLQLPLWRRVGGVLYSFLKRRPYNHAHRTKRIVQQHTDRFVRQYITQTALIKDHAQLEQYYQTHPAHAYVVGSDQVWRQLFVPMLSDYFLEFIPETDPVRRIAYAASFGVDPIDISAERIARYSSLLRQFVAVSVRELSAVKLLAQQFDCPAEWTLDPTMLLTGAEYIANLGLRSDPQAYIFAYLLDYTQPKEQLLQEIAQAHHAEGRICSPWRHRWQPGAKLRDCILPPVEEWLEGILNAQCVVTDSFHGVVFSLIFGKPFVGVVNKHRGNVRFDTLVEIFGLERQSSEEFELICSPEGYDPRAIAEIIATHRASSIDFLQTALA